MKITLKDIAKDTGLSISTVSRALARKGKISSKNEKKIFESAHRLNYPLNNVSTPVSLRDNIYIALITRFHPGEFYASFYEGFDLASKNTNVNFGLFNVANKEKSNIDFIASVKQDLFDAAVIFLPTFSESDYHELIEEVGIEFPMISAAPLATPVMDTVAFDNYRGGHLVAKHFHERGYKKIGIIQGPTSKIEAQLRKNGLTDYCETNGLEVIWDYHTNYDLEEGQAAYEHFKSSANKPEAIFASNDALGVGFMQRAIRDGLSIPKDVAIASYDDLPICKYHHPTITSVHADYETLGANILDMLMERLHNEEPTPHTGFTKLVPVTLNVRESS
jgi:DNA-binding LacI/PurR family transcriptional regulator